MSIYGNLLYLPFPGNLVKFNHPQLAIAHAFHKCRGVKLIPFFLQFRFRIRQNGCAVLVRLPVFTIVRKVLNRINRSKDEMSFSRFKAVLSYCINLNILHVVFCGVRVLLQQRVIPSSVQGSAGQHVQTAIRIRQRARRKTH